jgi:hypothetical protein
MEAEEAGTLAAQRRYWSAMAALAERHYSGPPFIPSLPAELQGVPWLEKPIPREQLTQTISRIRRADA